MKTAVIYARYSSDSQTEQSIDGQLRVCNEYAKTHDIVVVKTYIDRAMTGTNDRRPDFRRMIADSARKEWDYVLVYKFDRFSRNKYETAIHKKTLRDNGVKVVSAMENIPDTPEGIILESLIEGMNQYYSAELAQKVRRGMKESRIKGFYTGGPIAFGYRIENHRIVIDEAKAEIVRFIFRQYAEGVMVKDIIAKLTAKGILRNGKPFPENTIYNILKKEKYAGVYTCRGEVYDNLYPRIVPSDIFEIVQRKVKENKYGSHSVAVTYLLRKKVKCGYCGKHIFAECGTAKNGEVIRYYKCSGRKNGTGCRKEQTRKELLEKYVIENIQEHLSKPETLNYIAEGLLAVQERHIKENTALAAIQTEIRQTETAVGNIMAAIEQGGTSPTVMKRMRELELRIAELQKQEAIEKANSAIQLSKEQIIQYYKEGLNRQPLALVNYFVKEIVLYDDRMVIHYNTPQPISPDESQGFSFFIGNCKMPYHVQNSTALRYKDFELTMLIG